MKTILPTLVLAAAVAAVAQDKPEQMINCV